MTDEEIKEIKEEETVEEVTPTEPEVSEEVPETQEVTDQATEELSEEPVVEEPTEKVEEPSDNPEDVPEADTEVPEGDKPEEESTEVEEIKEEEKDKPTEEETIEPTVDERLAEAERKLAEYEEAKSEAESLARLNDIDNAIAQHIKETEQAVMKSMEDLAKKYNIPTNISMEDLEKQDPTKAAIAKEIAQNAQRVMMQKQQEMEQAREVEAAKVVFAKAEKIFDKHNLTQEQAEIAADTFIAIIKETGVQDLGQDLIEKVELSVAKALMKVPVAMEVHDKIEEIKNSDTKDLEQPTAEIAEDTDSKVEEKSEVPPPDLSEFMEGASGSRTAENPEAVTSENVIQKINSIADFRERTKFLAEHMDEFNEAMKNRKG